MGRTSDRTTIILALLAVYFIWGSTYLALRFGLEGSEPLTLAEIGRRINVSRERVRQLEAKAIMKLRLISNMQQAA